MRVVKEGGSIALAPEGNRTYSGKTEYMTPTIAPLARKLGLPIVLYHIEGGYGVQPRWADNIRRGQIDCYFSRGIEPEEYISLSDDELFALIKDGLYINEANSDNRFINKKSAEVDAEFKTPAANNLIYQNFPAIILGFPMLIFATFAPKRPLLTLFILAVFFAVLNVMLFRSFIFKKKGKYSASFNSEKEI